MTPYRGGLEIFVLAVALLGRSGPVVAEATRSAGVRLSLPGRSAVDLYDKSYALLIGVSDYTGGWRPLPGVKDDVRAVKDALVRHGFLVSEIPSPTRAEFDRSVRDFVAEHGQRPNDRLLVYFAGHGHTLKTSDERDLGYLVPADAPNPERDRGGFKRVAISMAEIEMIAEQIEAKHVLFVFDACFAGSVFEVTRGVPDHISEKAARPVRQFITSGSADQEVPDRSEFRRQFVDALDGKAEVGEGGYLTGSQLGEFLNKQVTNYSRRAQTPQWGKIMNGKLNKGDFVFELPGRSTGGKPVERPIPSPGAALLLDADAAGTLSVDGRSVGSVSPGEVRVVEVSAGDHVAIFSSNEIAYTERRDISVLPLTQTRVFFAVDGKIAAKRRDADPWERGYREILERGGLEDELVVHEARHFLALGNSPEEAFELLTDATKALGPLLLRTRFLQYSVQRRSADASRSCIPMPVAGGGGPRTQRVVHCQTCSGEGKARSGFMEDVVLEKTQAGRWKIASFWLGDGQCY